MKSYTDLEQSRKLAEFLPIESADMHCFVADSLEKQEINYAIRCGTPIVKTDIPCWSLAALIDVLPQFIEFKGDNYYLRFMKEYVEYANDEVSITGRYLHTTGNDNLVDACYEMILKLHELNLL